MKRFSHNGREQTHIMEEKKTVRLRKLGLDKGKTSLYKPCQSDKAPPFTGRSRELGAKRPWVSLSVPGAGVSANHCPQAGPDLPSACVTKDLSKRRTLIHLHIECGCFPQPQSWIVVREPFSCKAKAIYSLDLYRKSLMTPARANVYSQMLKDRELKLSKE